MSVLGLAHVDGLQPDTANAGMATINFRVCGVVSGSTYGPVLTSLNNISPASDAATMAAAVATQAQGLLTVVAGYTFGGGDSVSVFGL